MIHISLADQVENTFELDRFVSPENYSKKSLDKHTKDTEMSSIPKIPEHLCSIRDAAIEHVLNGTPEPELKPLYDWFEADGWDAVINAWAHEDMAFNLFYLAQDKFEDIVMAASEGFEVNEINDELRIKYARERIKKGYEDEHLRASLHVCELKRADGDSVILGCVMEIHGKGRPYFNWWGLFKTQDDFYDSIRNSGYIIESDLEGITNEKILSLWENKKMIDLRNCVFGFKCTANWNEMKRTSELRVRHCDQCEKDVYFITKPEELIEAINLNRCVAIAPPKSQKDIYYPMPLLGVPAGINAKCENNDI